MFCYIALFYYITLDYIRLAYLLLPLLFCPYLRLCSIFISRSQALLELYCIFRSISCLYFIFAFLWKIPFLSVYMSTYLWWPIVANFNLNHRQNFKSHLNFIFGMKIKSKFTFQIDIRNQIDFYFYFHFSFVVLVD